MSKKGEIISLNDFKKDRDIFLVEGKPYTGVFVDYYDYENEQKKCAIHFKDGKREGLGTWWYENGQKKYEIHHKDGELEGLWTEWHENGQKKEEIHYKDGEWDEEGTKISKKRFKDGVALKFA